MLPESRSTGLLGEQLSRPSKYADQLVAARQQQAQIEQTIAQRHAASYPPRRTS